MALSIHAPLAAFLGHVQQGGKKHQMAVGMLDHTAGLAAACGAAPVVIHPGFLLGRSRDDALTAVVAQLTELRHVWRPRDGRLISGSRSWGASRSSAISRTSWPSVAISTGCDR